MGSNVGSSSRVVEGGDAVTAELAAMLSRLGELAADPAHASDAVRIDRIALYEQTRAAIAAAQHTEMIAFARSQVAAQITDVRVDPRVVRRGIADQIGMVRLRRGDRQRPRRGAPPAASVQQG